MPAGPDETQPLYLDARLIPHRSLGPGGFLLLMLFFSGVSFACGIGFALTGAWPILGFYGLDVLAIYVGFRLNYRAGRLREEVRLSAERLDVVRVFPSGRRVGWSFQPYWVRVELRANGLGQGHIALASHGREVAIGSFLTEDERQDFAAGLRQALARALSDQPV
ncbi:MAG: DUF2244 domain-containing protein [Alphaproteobacteria bacterium]|nr:DUF2244 domain-containing protein [Alphaproteobacteria bacterium]